MSTQLSLTKQKHTYQTSALFQSGLASALHSPSQVSSSSLAVCFWGWSAYGQKGGIIFKIDEDSGLRNLQTAYFPINSILGWLGSHGEPIYSPTSTMARNSQDIQVLVIYLANPPVSDALQGAYLVAALSTGCITGGLALVFTDVTEGMGCAAGGFCLAMWLLSLKAGGLITSMGGRIGLISAFTLAAFCLSFSKYTKIYGLIGCEAFAGASITVLGIDCYSRAGLKEFWMYIWSRSCACIHIRRT